MDKEKCKVEGCKRKMIVKKHQLCRAHVNRFYRVGRVGTSDIPKSKNHNPYFGGMR